MDVLGSQPPPKKGHLRQCWHHSLEALTSLTVETRDGSNSDAWDLVLWFLTTDYHCEFTRPTKSPAQIRFRVHVPSPSYLIAEIEKTKIRIQRTDMISWFIHSSHSHLESPKLGQKVMHILGILLRPFFARATRWDDTSQRSLNYANYVRGGVMAAFHKEVIPWDRKVMSPLLIPRTFIIEW